MHLMLAEILNLDGTESVESHVQGYKANIHALRAQAIQQFGCKVQASRGSGGGANDARIDGLVALRIIQGLVNIRRQRHAPKLLDQFANSRLRSLACLRGEAYHASTSLRAPENLSLEPGGLVFAAKEYARPFAQAATWPHQRLPDIRPKIWPLGQQENLNVAAGFSATAQQACRNDAALVGNQQVTGTQIVANIAKMTMGERAGCTIDYEQARGIARLDRRLRD